MLLHDCQLEKFFFPMSAMLPRDTYLLGLLLGRTTRATLLRAAVSTTELTYMSIFFDARQIFWFWIYPSTDHHGMVRRQTDSVLELSSDVNGFDCFAT